MPLASKKIQTEKKPRASRKVKCEVPCVEVPCEVPCVEAEVAEEAAESLAESCIPTAEEQIREQVNNQFKQQLPELLNELGEDYVNCSLKFNVELKGPAFENEIMSAPVFEFPLSSDEESPVNLCISPKVKRCKKEVPPKPLQNEAGDYLNPKTNRYVKHGTSAFKKLVKEGLLNADCSINDQ